MHKPTKIQIIIRMMFLFFITLAIIGVTFLWPAGREIMGNIFGGLLLWFGLSYWIYAERASDPAIKKAALIVAGMAGALGILVLTFKLRSDTDDLFVTLYQLAGALIFVRMAV